MLKIAVCDDHQEDLTRTVAIIEDYAAKRADSRRIACTQFSNALDLLSAMERGQLFDLILLDIFMPLMTGMEAAIEIRAYNQDVKIIFLTSSTEHAIDSYTVKAYYYALKPVQATQLLTLLDQIISDSKTQDECSLLIKSKQGLVRAHIEKLEYAEVIGRTIFYHMTDGTVFEAPGAMFELEKALLSDTRFIKPHRSYIINMSHIDTLSQREIRMRSLAAVPMAKANSRAVKSAYLAYAFKAL